ncbi:hypothetical protein D915_008541 [Fasciola hepatica]|uniref:DZANK-type domain-containing protein n=1 Tax=Fasciola hepatica TaxID=6192 RepID=A0A4E0RUB1_FASHE|nr:hypothetical protein D915_008541 [Fasciola hepatica]
MSAGAVRAPLIIPLRVPAEGVPKSHIDSNTRLEILSETPNVDIYFTINGNRPTVSKHEKELLNTGTHRFQKPFTLPPGIQTVRAVAHSPDTGSESNVVTKTFDVAKSKKPQIKGQHTDDYCFLNDLKQIESQRRPRSSGLGKSGAQDLVRKILTNGRENQKQSRIVNGPSFEKDTKFPSTGSTETISKSFTVSSQRNGNLPRPDTTVQSEEHPFDSFIRHSMATAIPDPTVPFTRLQRLTDVVHCPHCFHVRSADPSHQFCGHCGLALPKLPIPTQPEPVFDQLGTCRTCGSNVPLNLPSCLVCEQSLHHSSKATPIQMLECRVCATCLTPNPVTVNSCLTCEASLPRAVTRFSAKNMPGFGPVTPPAPVPPMALPPGVTERNGRGSIPVTFVPCVHCRRQNNPDARYCDWCGLETQATPAAQNDHTVAWRPSSNKTEQSSPCCAAQALDRRSPYIFQCHHCGALTDRNSKFCCGCGAPIEPPARHIVWTEQLKTRIIDDTEGSYCSPDRTSYSPSKRTPSVIVANVATQTVGLFYPSSADLRRQSSLTRSAPGSDTQLRDRVPLLTPISPGRGYWRKQLDHIIAHFKVYTNNNPGFRSVIGEPRLGKLLTADLTESPGHATVLLTFTLPDSIYSTPSKGSEDYDLSADHSVNRPERETGDMLPNSKPRIALPRSGRHSASGCDNSDPALQTSRCRSEDETIDVDSDNRLLGGEEFGHRSLCQSDEVSNESLTLSRSGESVSVESGKCPRTRDRKSTSARSRPGTSTQSSRSGLKSTGRNEKKPPRGAHHGEAGVALQRDSKLTVSEPV